MKQLILVGLALALVLCGTGCPQDGNGVKSAEAPGAAEPEAPADRSDTVPDDARELLADELEPVQESATLAELRRSADDNPRDAEAQRRLGVALRHSGKADEGLERLERAVRIEPQSTKALLSLGIAYSAAIRLSDAEATYKRLLEIAPEHAKALNNLGNIALRRGDEGQAVAWYRRAVDADPSYLAAQYKLGGVLKYYGHYDEAAGVYEGILEADAEDPQDRPLQFESLYNLGAINLAQANYELAEKQLARVVRAIPAHRSAHYARAQALFQLNRDDEARNELQTHLQILAASGEGY